MRQSPPHYKLNKSRHILHAAYAWYAKNWQTLTHEQLKETEEQLAALDAAILKKDRKAASPIAKEIEESDIISLKKPFREFFWELFIALALALIIATIVRQMWFEPFEIPTGSMRPTFKEQDHLLVSKTTFGINFPLKTEHLYFDPSLVERAGIVIWSGENIDLPDTNTTYFWLFPYKKRYIKRCIGKPGDSLYFYGGKIYGVDQEGNDILGLRESPWMQKLAHVPYLTFEGKIVPNSRSSGNISEFIFRQMNKPVGRLTLNTVGQMSGQVFDGKNWTPDVPTAQDKPHTQIETYSDFFGIRNYAMARLLTKEELLNNKLIDVKNLEEGLLYLELRHTPSLSYPKPRFVQDEFGRYSLLITPYVTVIPLQERHLEAIMDNMYTARFNVVDGYAKKYSVDNHPFSKDSPQFSDVPNGTYEFYYGKAYKVAWGGITFELPPEDPLCQRTPLNIQKLFNLGMEMLTLYNPTSPNQTLFPFRYAYFRDGDFYLLDAPVIKQNDPTLIAFHARETSHEQQAPSNAPYVAFKDYGPPLKDGKIDKEFIRTFGVTVPEKHYLVLGDNYAMSADSRVFGFVPEQNLQGTPTFILWPPGNRWGFPFQKPYPLFTTPRIMIWGVAFIIACIWYMIHRRGLNKPTYKKLSS